MESIHLSKLFLNMVLFGNISFLFPPQKSHIFLLLPPQELHSPILANKPDLPERTCTDHNNFNHKASCTLTWATSAPAGSYHIRNSYSRLLTLPSKTFSCTSFIIINKNHNIQNAIQPAWGSYNMQDRIADKKSFIWIKSSHILSSVILSVSDFHFLNMVQYLHSVTILSLFSLCLSSIWTGLPPSWMQFAERPHLRHDTRWGPDSNDSQRCATPVHVP